MFLYTGSLQAQYTSPIDTTNLSLVPDSAMHGNYTVPDVPKKWINWTHYEGKKFSYKLGFVFLLDFTGFSQNDESIAQVSEQKNKLEIRALRLILSGQLKFKNPWQYFVSVEFRGFARDTGEHAFGLTDLYLAIPLAKGNHYGKLTIGKIKETHIYEMVGDAVNTPQTERILNPFFVSRNIGVEWSKVAINNRMTYAVGWFNDGWIKGVPLRESGSDVTARITGLPVIDKTGATYLHVGVSSRYIGAERNTLRYKGKVESNVSDYYVDSKSFDAVNGWNLAGEFLYNVHNYSLTAEWVRNWNNATASNNPIFGGWNIVASWVITGEHRPYDKQVAYARRIMPTGKKGAWELVARYSHLDLQDNNIDGGILDKWHLGVNWWASQHWRCSMSYGISTLDRFDKRGITNQLLTRIQWVL
jgi:phosphate-selective porin